MFILKLNSVSFITFSMLACMIACNSHSSSDQISDTSQTSSIDSLLSQALEHCSSNTDLCELLLEKAKAGLNSEVYPQDLAKYHFASGKLNYYLDRYESSIQHYDSAQAIYEQLPFKKELAKTYSSKGVSLALSGEFPDAVSNLMTAIEMFEELQDKEALCSTCNTVARVYVHQKQYDQALQYLERSEREVDDTLSLTYANILSSKADIYRFKGELEKTEAYIERAYEIRVRCANIRHIAISLVKKAQLKMQMEEYDEARNLLNETIGIYIELNEKTGLFNAYHLLTKIDIRTEDYVSAKQNADKALSLALEMENTNHLSQVERNLYAIYRAEGKYEEALAHYEKHQEYQAELFSIEKSRQITDIEHRHAIESRDKDNQILSQQNRLRKQHLWLLASLCFGLLLVLIGLVIFIRTKTKVNRQKQEMLKSEKEIAEAKSLVLQNEKKLLEQDLELKSRELTGKTVELLRQIETIQSLSARIEDLKNPDSKSEIESILNELNASTRDTAWEEFHTAFNNVHKEFYDRLFERSPDLSPTEIKIAALLKLNLSTKEIAAISYKSESAVKTARHRLRQKLQLEQDENLLSFLMKI